MNARRAIAAACLLALASLACGPKASSPVSAAPAAPAATPPPAAGFRLPGDARPLAYRITLTVDPASEVITGTGEIDVERRTAGGVLYLHANELTIDRAAIVAGTTRIPLTATPVDVEMLAFVPTDPCATLPAGRVTVELSWKARVHRTDSSGALSQQSDGAWFAFSNFEPTDARRVFPSFDEPQLKARWQLTLQVPAGLVALSNTPVESEARIPAPTGHAGEWTRVRFVTTPPLSTYLISYTVGPYEMVDAGKTRGGAPVRVAVPRGHATEATIPVEDTVPILNLLEDYFGTPYPFAKLDLVPIPDTVGFGAMENVGLITYRSSLLLTKPADRTFWDRRSYDRIAAHEIAHQWFGNVVTTAWWDDIWLNESFASWMGDRIVDQWRPDWETDLGHVSSKGSVMGADSRESTRRIREPVGDENGLADAFDGSIVYGKGRAVITMIEAHLGAETFQKGIRLYLAKHAWGNASLADLTAALEEASGQELSAVVDDFVNQPGVPYVGFTLACEKGAKPKLDWKQQRYVPFESPMDPKRTWHVPVVVRWKAGAKTGSTSTILDGASGTLALADAPSCPDWVMPNAGGNGYYRWSLDDASFQKLRSPAVFKALPPEERLEVAASVQALVDSGALPYRRSVEMAVTLIGDPVRPVRQIGVGAGAGWTDWLPTEVVPKYRAWVAKTYTPLAKELGFEPKKGESEDDKQIRSQVLWRMARDAKDPATIREATRLTWKWLDDRTALSAETVDLALAIAAASGDAKLYDRFLAEARKANAAKDKPERERFLGMLHAFGDLALADRTRALILGDEFPVIETYGFLWDGTDSKEGEERAWTHLTKNYDVIMARLPAESRARVISVGGNCTTAGLERTKAFFHERTKKELKGPQTYDRFVESQLQCISRRAKDTASFVEMLTEPQSSPRK